MNNAQTNYILPRVSVCVKKMANIYIEKNSSSKYDSAT
jgi:hypothetical protein